MIAIAWQFDVTPGYEADFEQFYGADGDWTALNRHSRSYLGTSFLRDQTRRSRYLVIEYWSEMLVYEEHKAFRDEEIARLDDRRSELVASVEPLGVFTALDVPERTGPTWSRRT
jgi:heme-degrading monooxygenase HmoA